ncbi:MAG: DUF642 domain-containing protein [Nanoarchaeota archaeon]|nr:DUF642 domain-containing protein [Nanoarchaeota archaeon]
MKKIRLFGIFFMVLALFAGSVNAKIMEPGTCDGNPGIELVINGGFETPVVTATQNWNIYPSGTTNLGWNVNWYSTSTSYNSYTRPSIANLELQRGVSGWFPAEGSQYAELDTDWNGLSGSLNGEPASVSMFQDLATIPGETYKIRFMFSPRPETSSQDNILVFSWEGAVKDTISAAGQSNTAWSTHEYEFKATSSTTRINFDDAGIPNSLGTFVDDVSVKCIQTPVNDVPEFSTMGALAVLGGIWLFISKKRKQN